MQSGKQKFISGEIRLTNIIGVVMHSDGFKSLHTRRKLTEKYFKEHGNKINSGEWILSYLLD